MAGARYVNIARAKAQLSELVDRAANGEEIVIARDHRAVARLVPLSRGRRQPGSGRGQLRIAPDFDAPLDDFEGYSK